MRRFRRLLIAVGGIAWAVVAAGPAVARNVDLSTVPKRDSVQLTIYNSEDLTLVRETRTITFKKGVNPLQFSWANTLIDPTSVEFRALTDRAIKSYFAKINPLDKAGAYAAQGHGKEIIQRIEGSYSNVVGLPMETTARVLRAFGITPQRALWR